MRYDGSINFDTRIDSGGFNRGIRAMPNAVEGLKRTFENLAKTIGIAFSVGAVINFSKACLSANQTQIEAEARAYAEELGVDLDLLLLLDLVEDHSDVQLSHSGDCGLLCLRYAGTGDLC